MKLVYSEKDLTNIIVDFAELNTALQYDGYFMLSEENEPVFVVESKST